MKLINLVVLTIANIVGICYASPIGIGQSIIINNGGSIPDNVGILQAFRSGK
jgi:hypothetical protein